MKKDCIILGLVLRGILIQIAYFHKENTSIAAMGVIWPTPYQKGVEVHGVLSERIWFYHLRDPKNWFIKERGRAIGDDYYFRWLPGQIKVQ